MWSFDQIKRYFQKRIEQHEQRLDTVEPKVASHETRVTSNTEGLANAEQRLIQLEAGSKDSEVIAARGGYGSLADRLNALDPGAGVLQKSFLVGSGGQSVFDISDVGSYQPGSNRIIQFIVGGVPQFTGIHFTETSSTKLTTVAPVPEGVRVFIQWFDTNVSLLAGHSRKHRKGGGDELDVRDLAGYQEYVASRFDTIIQKKVNLELKTASVTVNGAMSDKYDNYTYFDQVFGRLAVQGLDVTLITTHNITDATSSTFTHITSAQIQNIIDRAKSRGLRIRMIKPHIVLNWSDGFPRKTHNPSDISAFFTNWTQELLFVAAIADANDVEWLSISCEQYLVTTANHYYNQWKTLINTIRAAYPKLKLTASMMGTELDETIKSLKTDPTNLSMFELLDSIGFNMYFSAYWAYYAVVNGKPTVTVRDVEKSLYKTVDGWSPMALIQSVYDMWKKPILITEFGCMNKTGGLINLSASGTENYDTQALLFQAVFDNVMPLFYVKGFAIWHVHAPFQYFDYTGATVTAAEKIVIDYVKGGKL